MISIKRLEDERISKSKAHHYPVKLMGCHFVITAIDADPQKAWDAIRAGVREMQRIEMLISSWKESSETSKVNRNAGIQPVKVCKELWDLIFRSQRVSKLTSGAFDLSGTLSRYYWNFNRKENLMLPMSQIEELRALIDYRNIELNSDDATVFLLKKGMKIGFGGIGKGYAAHQAKIVMEAMGIRGGLINASGDLMCWGLPPGKDEWSINIPDPEDSNQSILDVSMPYGSLVTSGNYENYSLINGKRYSHIVDPRTGMPVIGISSVSVICPNPELGDALATAISVMGPEEGIALINRINGIECLVIDEKNQRHFSYNLNCAKAA